GSAGDNIYPSQSNPSNDTTTISTYSFTFNGYTYNYYHVTDSIGNPVPGTGPNDVYQNHFYDDFYAPGVRSITVDSGHGTYVVNDTSNFSRYTLLETGGATDSVNVNGNHGNLDVANGGGEDFVTVGNGTLGAVQGNVYVGGAGATALTVLDQNDTTPKQTA